METIKQQVQIPEDHRLNLEVEVPASVPSGPAEVVVSVNPTNGGDPEERLLSSYAGCLADSKWIKRGGLVIQRELRDEWD